ncbi:hypothetical protein GCM10009696_00820 [Kocuria himachalensis]
MWMAIIPINATPRAASIPIRRRRRGPTAALLAPVTVGCSAPGEAVAPAPVAVHGALCNGCLEVSVMTSSAPLCRTGGPPARRTGTPPPALFT